MTNVTSVATTQTSQATIYGYCTPNTFEIAASSARGF